MTLSSDSGSQSELQQQPPGVNCAANYDVLHGSTPSALQSFEATNFTTPSPSLQSAPYAKGKEKTFIASGSHVGGSACMVPRPAPVKSVLTPREGNTLPTAALPTFGSSQASLLGSGSNPKKKRQASKRKIEYVKGGSNSTPSLPASPLAVPAFDLYQFTPDPPLYRNRRKSHDLPPLPPHKLEGEESEIQVGSCASATATNLHRPSVTENPPGGLLWNKLKIQRPDIVEQQGYLDELFRHYDLADDMESKGEIPKSDPSHFSQQFWNSMGIHDNSQTSGPPLPKRKRGAARLHRPDVTHRPHTRSMSKVRKVYIAIEHFSPYDDLELHYPGAEFMVGDLVEIVECPFTKRPMVRVDLKGFSYPQEFLVNQVFIAAPVDVLPTVQYAEGCVCCKPEGEVDLPNDSSPSDLSYNSEHDMTPATALEYFVEADREWLPVSAEEHADLKEADAYFRYLPSLPFEKKFHDVHWMRNYRGCFASSREWLGKEGEVGMPRMNKPSTPLEILDQFITRSTWVKIVKQTNIYAKQKERKGWTALTVAELCCWLGICIFMGVKRLPEMAMHWNKSHPLLANHFISDLMPRDRWLDIMAMVHLVHNSSIAKDKEDPSYDKIVKIRWFLDEVCSRFRAVKPVDRFLSIDEMMVKCLARMCPVKQFNKDKPVSHGIKIWALASASTKYVYALDVFCGAQSGPAQTPAVRQPVVKAHEDKSTYKVVMHLCESVPNGVGHVITMDNYFTGVPLFADLHARKIFCTGTARPGISGWPSSMPWNKKLKGNWGDLRWRMHASKEIGACVWFDKKPVGILSTYALPWSAETTVQRREGATVSTYSTSPSLISYIKLMRGVDVADQIRGGYSVSRRGRRWWKRGLFFIFDTALCNAWVLGKQLWEGSSKFDWPYHEHLAFNIALADNLVEEWRCKRAAKIQQATWSGIGKQAHGPSRSSQISRSCVECKRRTFWFCGVCPRSPHMCVAPNRSCYQEWHQKKKSFL